MLSHTHLTFSLTLQDLLHDIGGWRRNTAIHSIFHIVFDPEAFHLPITFLIIAF
jgi:hypothetical protein